MNNKVIKIILAISVVLFVAFITLKENINLEGSLTQSSQSFFKEIPAEIKTKFKKNLDSEFKSIAKNKTDFKRFNILNSIALGDVLSSNLESIESTLELKDLNPKSAYLVVSSDLSISQIGSLLRSSKDESKLNIYENLEFLDLIYESKENQLINSGSYAHKRENLIVLEIRDFKDLAFTEYSSLFNRKLFYKSLNLDRSNEEDSVKETLNLRYQDFITKVISNKNKEEIKYLLNGVYNNDNKNEISGDLKLIERDFLSDDLDEYKKATVLRQMLKLESKKDLNSIFISDSNEFESDFLTQIKTINSLNFDFSSTRTSNLFNKSDLNSFNPSFARQIKENNLKMYLIKNTSDESYSSFNKNDLNKLKTLNLSICDEDSLSETCHDQNLKISTFDLNTDSDLLQLNFNSFKGLYVNSNLDLIEYLTIIQNSEKILNSNNLNSYYANLDALINQSKNLRIKIVQNINKDTAFKLSENTGSNPYNTIKACEISGHVSCLSNSEKANFHYLLNFEENQLSLINIKQNESLASKLSQFAFSTSNAANIPDSGEIDITIPSIKVTEPNIKDLTIPNIPMTDNEEISIPFIPESETAITPPFISDNKKEFVVPPYIKEDKPVIIPPFVANMMFGRTQLLTIPYVMEGETIVATQNPVSAPPAEEPAASPARGSRGGSGGGGSRGSAETGFVPCVDILPYTDVAPSDPNYFKYIWAYCNEIFTGRTNKDGTKSLEPNAFFNRAEFAKIGVTLFQTPIIPYNRVNKLFLDIERNNTEWYMDYLNTGKEKGIITGYTGGNEKGKFLPENRISFAETVAISFRSGVDAKLIGNIKKVPWYSDLIVNYKKLEAVGKNTPGETQITRKQAILIIYDLWSKGIFGDKFN